MACVPDGCQQQAITLHAACFGRGMIQLETLIELFELNPLIEIGQTVPRQGIGGNSISVNSILPPLLLLSS